MKKECASCSQIWKVLGEVVSHGDTKGTRRYTRRYNGYLEALDEPEGFDSQTRMPWGEISLQERVARCSYNLTIGCEKG